jgi:hypothetical protein
MDSFGRTLAMMPLNILSFCDRNTLQKTKILNKNALIVTHAPYVDNMRQQLIRERFALNRLDELWWECIMVFGSNKEVTKLCIKGEGQIPACIGEFKYLKNLIILENMSYQFITGSIPKEIGLLQELESLEIRGHLVSYLPKSMKMMTKLKILKLKDNVILGEIPQEFFEGETGPLRFPDSIIKIWDRYLDRGTSGDGSRHIGSILNMPIKQRVSTYSKWSEEDPDDKYSSWVARPWLRRSNAITKRTYWWGTMWE